jgi:hypothetical protein
VNKEIQSRKHEIKNPALISAGALEPLQALSKAAEKGGTPKGTVELVHLGVSPDERLDVWAEMSQCGSQ